MRHNDYPATLLMEQPEPEERSRYRMRMAASTKRGMLYEPTSAELTRAYDYEHDCMMFERGDHYFGPTKDDAPNVEPVAGGKSNADNDLAQENETQVAASEAEVWHTEAPTVAGVYQSRNSFGAYPRHWDGRLWSRYLSPGDDPRAEPRMSDHKQAEVQWLRLIEADTPAPAAQIPDWRTGDQVPQHERVGLWHYESLSKWRESAVPAERLTWLSGVMYRAAAPGSREGDPYDESRYFIQA